MCYYIYLVNLDYCPGFFPSYLCFEVTRLDIRFAFKIYLSFPGSIVGVVSKTNGVICSVVGNIVCVMGLWDYRIYIFYLVTADRDC